MYRIICSLVVAACFSCGQADKEIITFDGIASAELSGTATAILAWKEASSTGNSSFTYDVYWTQQSKAYDLKKPNQSLTQLSTVVLELEPGTTYYFLVKARIDSGFRDGNTTEHSLKIPADTEAPSFVGIETSEALSGTSVKLVWQAAVDNVTTASQLSYRICYSKIKDECIINFTDSVPLLTGVTETTIDGLEPATVYYFLVRAVDAVGNAAANVQEIDQTTQDLNPPDFAGVALCNTLTQTNITLSWDTALDDLTDNTDLRYLVYYATTSGGQDFQTPLANSADGETHISIGNLEAGTTYYFVARARDLDGNTESNTTEVTCTTNPDIEAPSFAGINYSTTSSGTVIRVQWSNAIDDLTLTSDILYDVCYSTTPGGCSSSFVVAHTTAPGIRIADIGGLTPSTTYYFLTRARDEVGNSDSNTVEYQMTTRDTISPVFAGATGATAIDTHRIQLTWDAASDDYDEASSLVYYIYRATSPGGQNYSFPSHISLPGATSLTASNLDHNTTYYYIVRARDDANNSDGNFAEVSATTLTDITAPQFSGANEAALLSTPAFQISAPAAVDNHSAQASLTYQLYYATTSGGQDFLNPGEVSSSPIIPTSGLTRLTDYYFVMRTTDEAGNQDTNTVEITGRTSIDNVWDNKADMNYSRYWHSASVYNDKIYVFGGSGATNRSEVYDPDLDSWQVLADMPLHRSSHCGATYEDKVYLFGGSTSAVPVLAYEIDTDSWETKSNLPTSVRFPGCAVVGNRIYVIGGLNSTQQNIVQEYDPTTDTWTNCGTEAPDNSCATMPRAVLAMGVAVVNDTIYAFGGESSGSSDDHTQIYDPVANSWTMATDMPSRRATPGTGVIDGKVYVFGGWYGSGSRQNSNYEYDPVTDTWETKTSLNYSRDALAGATVGTKIYAIGGGGGWRRVEELH